MFSKRSRAYRGGDDEYLHHVTLLDRELPIRLYCREFKVVHSRHLKDVPRSRYINPPCPFFSSSPYTKPSEIKILKTTEVQAYDSRVSFVFKNLATLCA